MVNNTSQLAIASRQTVRVLHSGDNAARWRGFSLCKRVARPTSGVEGALRRFPYVDSLIDDVNTSDTVVRRRG
jgi:hypothetical protein